MALRVAIALLSGAAIAYQILLMRILSIVQWHHFAYMVISLALLGYGASGSFLALFRRALLRRFGPAFAAAAALFGILSAGCFALAQRIPFNPLEAVWDLRQLGYLAGLYLLLALPFFCAATAVGLALARFGGEIHRLYRADLAGAGAGALLLVAALFLLPVSDCLLAIGSLGLLAAAVAALDPRLGLGRPVAALAAALALAAPLLWPSAWLAPRLSEYKPLSKTLQVPGAEVVAERSSPLGLLTAVRSPTIPFRVAPGLSLAYRGEPPEQLAIFTDGDAPTVVDRAAAGSPGADYLDYLPSALPYRLLRRPRVAVIGAGGGNLVRQALRLGAERVDAVEVNPQLLDLVAGELGGFAGELYADPRVRPRVAEARGFLASGGEVFDLIQIAYLDAAAGSAAVQSLSESYLYTVEAIETYLRRLSDGGLLSVTRFLELPPRAVLKLALTAAEALERSGASDPEQRIALIQSWNAVTLLVRRGSFGAAEVEAIRRFCDERSFDLAYLPGMAAEEAGRFDLAEEPELHLALTALLSGDRTSFVDRYKFDLRPATDDRPYFHDFFRWRSLRELLSLRLRGGAPLVEWGYLILVATLAQAALAGLLLILLPLALLERRRGHPATGTDPPTEHPPGGLQIFTYFLALGLAFLFVEIAFIQRFTLFLAHPLYAVAVVLAAFLLFAGLGSGESKRLERWLAARSWLPRPLVDPVAVAVAGIAALSLLYLALLPGLFGRWMGLPTAPKLALSLALIAPLAFCMGMPFPLGLRRVAAARPEWVPWAWGFNGWASVLAAVLATLLAIHLGFSAVVLLAVGLYLTAAWAARGLDLE